MKIRRNSYRAGAKRKIDKGAASHSPRPARGPTDQARRQAGCEQIQLPSTGAVAGLGGALEGRGGGPRPDPRPPPGAPPPPSPNAPDQHTEHNLPVLEVLHRTQD